MLYNLHFFSSKCRFFHNATLFGFCITHILNTGCAKIWKKKVCRQKVKHVTTGSHPKFIFVRQNTIRMPYKGYFFKAVGKVK